MKRCFTVFAALLLVVGCSAKTARPQPVLEADPEELAREMWSVLSETPCPHPLSEEELELLLDLSPKAYSGAIALFVPDAPLEAQLFLLKSDQEGDELHRLLQNRLELVRQTSAAWLGKEPDAEQYGRVLSKGGWCCMAVPAAHKLQQTEKACNLFLSSFS